MRLTAATVRTVQCAPGKNEQVIFDEALPGFGLRVRTTGAKTWLVQYAVAGRTKRIFLGAPALVDASKARAMAKDLLARVRLGGDPAGEKVAARAEAANTVGALLPRFLAHQRGRLKPRSHQETTRRRKRATSRPTPRRSPTKRRRSASANGCCLTRSWRRSGTRPVMVSTAKLSSC